MREYFKAFHSFRAMMEPLKDAERGRLFTALLEYSETGEVLSLSGSELYTFYAIKPFIDKDKEQYSETCRRNAANARGGESNDDIPVAPSRTQSHPVAPSRGENAKKEERRKKEEEKDEDNISSNKSTISYQSVVDQFNAVCVSLPKVRAITDSRRKEIRSRLNDIGGDMDEMRRIFEEIEASDFLSGRSGKWSGCSFDWIFKPANFVKIREGTYANRNHPGETNGRYAPTYDTDEIERMLDEQFMEG